MNYYWTVCPHCGCQVTIQWSAASGRADGSLRRWSTDRTVNDGRPFQANAPDGAFATPCVCGHELPVPGPAAVGGNRESATPTR